MLTLQMDVYLGSNFGTKLLMKQMEKRMLEVQIQKTAERLGELCKEARK